MVDRGDESRSGGKAKGKGEENTDHGDNYFRLMLNVKDAGKQPRSLTSTCVRAFPIFRFKRPSGRQPNSVAETIQSLIRHH